MFSSFSSAILQRSFQNRTRAHTARMKENVGAEIGYSGGHRVLLQALDKSPMYMHLLTVPAAEFVGPGQKENVGSLVQNY